MYIYFKLHFYEIEVNKLYMNLVTKALTVEMHIGTTQGYLIFKGSIKANRAAH